MPPPADRDEPAESEAREARAGPDGWPRLPGPGGFGYVRMSMNMDTAWDFRSVCDVCKTSFTRTCRPPGDRVRPETKAFGQGRPLGKTWLWLKLAAELPRPHSASDHPCRNWQPSFEDRRSARVEAMAQPGAQDWASKERPVDLRADGPDGEPLYIP